jgi:hypothetical protein
MVLGLRVKMGSVDEKSASRENSQYGAFKLLFFLFLYCYSGYACYAYLAHLTFGHEEFFRSLRHRTSSNTKVYLISRNTCNIV